MSVSSGITEVSELFDLMESNQPSVVQDIKNLIQENFNTTKESWLVGGLFDYYIQTHSTRCMEILIGISREPHDRFLIEKINEGLRSVQNRKQSLILFGHLVRKQPSWLYKISNLGLLKELIKILRTETDMVILLTGLLIITTTLPIIPTYMSQFINDIFDVFGRLAVWTHSSHNIAEEHVLHLQVGLYSLFHRLYAMYPCNFLSYLRHNFSSSDKRVVFLHAIKPMLETVKMHPLLVTATKEGELSSNRWRNKEYHDVIAECSQLSLDVFESGLPEELNLHLRPRLSTTTSIDYSISSPPITIPSVSDPPFNNLPTHQMSSLIRQSMNVEMNDLSSLATMVDDITPQQTPLSVISTTNPTNPIQLTTTPTIVMNPSLIISKNTTPPEAAMEATPENTPIPTPVKDRDRVHFKLPPSGSPAVAHLAFGKPTSSSINSKIPQTPPPTPSNSIPSSPAPHTGENLNTIGGGGGLHRRDSIFDSMRRDSVMFQRLQKVMIDQQNTMTTTTKDDIKKPSPITLGDTVVTLEPIHGSSCESGPLTPMLGSSDPSMDVVDDIEEHICSTACPIGSIPMPDTKSMMAYAKRVSGLRLRYYSHNTDHISDGPSPGTSPSTTQFIINKLKRSNSCPNIFKQPIIEEFNDSDSIDGISSSSKQQHNNQEQQQQQQQEQEQQEQEQQQQQQQQQQEQIIEKIQPYEHFFDGLLPPFLQCPGENQSHFQSPHYLLDLCLIKAASLHGKNGGGGIGGGGPEDDNINILKCQLELLHSQLLFERHRRESHALRNRSLAKKCRSVQHKEDQNYALRSQMHILEKEVATLKKEIGVQRNMGQIKEKELQQIVSDLESKVDCFRRDISTLHETKNILEIKYTQMNLDYQILHKESDQRRADIFQLENDNKHCRKYIDINTHLKTVYETSQKEILLLGELCRRQQEIIYTYEPHRYLLHEMEDLRNCCEHEINGLKDILETKASQTEAALGYVKTLQEQLSKKDITIDEQKKLLYESSIEHDVQLKAMSEKYEFVKMTNHRLELEILNLQHQLATKSYCTRQSVRHISPSNGDSSHSNVSDVDSAASAGGMQLSPERSMFIFGSPQFDPPPSEMYDLQSVIDKENTTSEISSRTRGLRE